MTLPLITPKDAARVYGTSVSNIYRLASLHKWRRLRLHGRVHYHLEDVDQHLGRDTLAPQ